MGPDDDLGRLRANQTTESKAGEWLDIGLVTLIKGVVEIQSR